MTAAADQGRDHSMKSFSFSHDPRIAEQEMHAIIFYLTAFGYIDGDFDDAERAFVRDYVAKLVQRRAADAGLDAATTADVVPRLTEHFHEVLASIDAEIAALFTESVGEGEEQSQFVLAKLKLRCFELFKQFDEDNRARLLSTVDALMHADGVVHPNEVAFRDELSQLLTEPMEFDDADIEDVPAGAVVIGEALSLAPRLDDHPFLKMAEWPYASDAATFSDAVAGRPRADARRHGQARAAGGGGRRAPRRRGRRDGLRGAGALPRRARLRACRPGPAARTSCSSSATCTAATRA